MRALKRLKVLKAANTASRILARAFGATILANIDPLTGHFNLETLDLSGTAVGDISPLWTPAPPEEIQVQPEDDELQADHENIVVYEASSDEESEDENAREHDYPSSDSDHSEEESDEDSDYYLGMNEEEVIADINEDESSSSTEIYIPGHPIQKMNISVSDTPQLRHLDLSNTAVGDLWPTGSLPHITTLNLYNLTNVININALRGARELRKLILFNTSVINLDPLVDCDSLEHLDISTNLPRHPHIDISPLQNCPNLSELDISGRSEALIYQIGGLDSLRILHANQLQNAGRRNLHMSHIANHQGLEVVSLQGVRVRKVRALGDAPNLREIHLSKSFSPKSQQAVLTELKKAAKNQGKTFRVHYLY